MFVYQFSEAGTSHVLTGTENQDAHAVHVAANSAFVFMADGMGSARLGGQAACEAVQTASKLVPWTHLSGGHAPAAADMLAMKVAFPIAYNALSSLAVKNDWDAQELLTTFMCAIYDGTDHRLTYGFCGDGGIVALTRMGEVGLLTRAAKGAQRHQTTPLHSVEGWTFGQRENIQSFFMCTDGVLDALCPETAFRHDARRRKLVRRLLKMPALTNEGQLRIALDNAFSSAGPACDDLGRLMQGVTDDRTIVLVSGKTKRACLDARSRAEGR